MKHLLRRLPYFCPEIISQLQPHFYWITQEDKIYCIDCDRRARWIPVFWWKTYFWLKLRKYVLAKTAKYY